MAQLSFRDRISLLFISELHHFDCIIFLVLGICSMGIIWVLTVCEALCWMITHQDIKTNRRSLLSNLPSLTECQPWARHFPSMLTTPWDRCGFHLHLRTLSPEEMMLTYPRSHSGDDSQDSSISLLFSGSWGLASLKELADPMADQVVVFMQPLSRPKMSFSVNSWKSTGWVHSNCQTMLVLQVQLTQPLADNRRQGLTFTVALASPHWPVVVASQLSIGSLVS